MENQYGSAKTLERAEKDGLYPPSFVVYLDASERANHKIKTNRLATIRYSREISQSNLVPLHFA